MQFAQIQLLIRGFQVAVVALGQEDPLKKGMATHSSILARRIPWTEEPGGLQTIGSQSRTWSDLGLMHTTSY